MSLLSRSWCANAVHSSVSKSFNLPYTHLSFHLKLLPQHFHSSWKICAPPRTMTNWRLPSKSSLARRIFKFQKSELALPSKFICRLLLLLLVGNSSFRWEAASAHLPFKMLGSLLVVYGSWKRHSTCAVLIWVLHLPGLQLFQALYPRRGSCPFSTELLQSPLCLNFHWCFSLTYSLWFCMSSATRELHKQ